MPVLYLVVGVAAGVLSGLFGIGGGVLIVAALMLVMKMAPATATGTSLGALLLPVGALGAWEYWRQGHLDIRAALWISAGLFAGAWFGAKIALSLSPTQLKRAFAIFLVIMAVRLWTTATPGTAEPSVAPKGEQDQRDQKSE